MSTPSFLRDHADLDTRDPRGDGSIPEEDAAILHEVGRRLRHDPSPR